MGEINIFVRIRSNFEEFSRELIRPQKQFSKLENKTGLLNQRFKKLGRTGARLGRNFRFLTTGFRGFRMEMLSVMFGGMMLSGVLWGLLQPALEVTGIFELFGAMLTILFLPVVMALLPIFLEIFNFFVSLPEGVKLAIGIFVLLAAVFFTVLAVVGSLILFIGGLILAAGAIGTVFGIAASVVLGAFALIAAGIMIAIIAVAVAAYVIIKHWDDIKAVGASIWGFIKERFLAFWDAIKPLVMAIKDNFLATWNFVKEAALLAWEYIKKVFLPLYNWWKEKVTDPIIGAFQGLWEKAKEIGDKILDKMKAVAEAISKPLNFATDKLKSGAEFFKSNRMEIKGSEQTGGYIPHTGLYKLHAGETVQQAGSTNNFQPSIVINASSNVDIEMLKTQLNRQWSEEFGRLVRG